MPFYRCLWGLTAPVFSALFAMSHWHVPGCDDGTRNPWFRLCVRLVALAERWRALAFVWLVRNGLDFDVRLAVRASLALLLGRVDFRFAGTLNFWPEVTWIGIRSAQLPAHAFHSVQVHPRRVCVRFVIHTDIVPRFR